MVVSVKKYATVSCVNGGLGYSKSVRRETLPESSDRRMSVGYLSLWEGLFQCCGEGGRGLRTGETVLSEGGKQLLEISLLCDF